jgi:hypothetical protein
MEHAMIRDLLEKYWAASTTVEEEKTLAEYFRQATIAPDLEPYRDVFGYFGMESELKAGPGLETRILENIRELEQGTKSIRILRRQSGWWAAAAALILGLGLYLLTPSSHPSVVPVGQTIARQDLPPAPTEVKDTYEDPRQALAAIRNALFKVSGKMNKGRKITARQMGRMGDAWQAVVKN